jgi:plasmid stabilization system protein ParE
MSFIVNWDSVAINSYIHESEFILLKWNSQEVQKFHDLVEENLSRLCKNPEIGIYNDRLQSYYLVISKQTTLYYSFNVTNKIIELHLFGTILKTQPT